jgi:hypothetical protein
MDSSELGEKLAVHRWKSGGGLVFVWLVMGVPWIYLLFRIPIHDAGDAAIAIGFSAFVFGLLGWLTRMHFKKKNDHVDVHEHGLVHVVGGVSKSLRWDEIDKVTSKVEQRGVSTLHVHTVEGKGLRWTFTQIHEDIEALAHAIVVNVSRVIADRAMMRIRAGEEAPLGPLHVSSKGILKGSDLLPWAQVESIRASGNTVRIAKKGAMLAWAAIDVGSAHAQALVAMRSMSPELEDGYR